MKNKIYLFLTACAFAFSALANEDTNISPAGKAEALSKRPYFGCVHFPDMLNSNVRVIGKGKMEDNGSLKLLINSDEKHRVEVEYLGWGPFGAAFSMKIDKNEVSQFNGSGIGYIEFNQYTDKSGKLKLGDFSNAIENSADGVLNHYFCSPMTTFDTIQ